MLDDFIKNKEDLYTAKLDSENFKNFFFTHFNYINERYKDLILFKKKFYENFKDIHPNLRHNDLDVNNIFFSFSNMDENNRAEYSYFNQNFEISKFRVLFRVNTLYFYIVENDEIKYRISFDENDNIVLDFINTPDFFVTVEILEKNIPQTKIIQDEDLFSEKIIESKQWDYKKTKHVSINILEITMQLKNPEFIEFLKFTDFKVEDIYMSNKFREELSEGYRVLNIRDHNNLTYCNPDQIRFILFSNIKKHCKDYGMKNEANSEYVSDLKELQQMGINVINPFLINQNDIEMFKINKVI